MMLPTHALVGLALAAPVAFVAPEFAAVAFGGGIVGGIAPDLDLFVGHRKTLHYPTYFSVLAGVAVPLAVFVSTAATVAVAVALLAAAAHCVMDVFGGGLELRPWKATSMRAVYDHRRGRWLAPRRWIRYDGAPEDLLFSVALAIPLLGVLDGAFRWVVVAALGVAVVYAALRRTIPAVVERVLEGLLVDSVPDGVLGRIPSRYRGG